MTNRPGQRTIKINMRLYEQIMVMAAEMGIDPGTLVEEAVVYYLLSAKEKIIERVQERVDVMFAKLEALPSSLPLLEKRDNDG